MKRGFLAKWTEWSWGFTNPKAVHTYNAQKKAYRVPEILVFAASMLAPLQVLRAATHSSFGCLVSSDPAMGRLQTGIRSKSNIAPVLVSQALQGVYQCTTVTEVSAYLSTLTYLDNNENKLLYSEQEIKTISDDFANLEFSKAQRKGIPVGINISITILQGTATYAAVYGLKKLCLAYLEGIAIPIAHGITASLAGIWLTTGEHWHGIVSGALIGATAFALQQYALPALAEAIANIYPLSYLELQLIGGAMTAIAAQPISLLISAIWERFDTTPKLDRAIGFRYEFPLLGLLAPEPPVEQAK